MNPLEIPSDNWTAQGPYVYAPSGFTLCICVASNGCNPNQSARLLADFLNARGRELDEKGQG